MRLQARQNTDRTAISVATQFGYGAHAPTKRTRTPKKRVYRSGIESFAQRGRDKSGKWEPGIFGVDRVITFVTEIKG